MAKLVNGKKMSSTMKKKEKQEVHGVAELERMVQGKRSRGGGGGGRGPRRLHDACATHERRMASGGGFEGREWSSPFVHDTFWGMSPMSLGFVRVGR